MANKSCSTVVKDINKVLKDLAEGKGKISLSPEKLAEFGGNVAMKLDNALKGRAGRVRPAKTLFMSEIGKPCKRQLWYDVNQHSFGSTTVSKEPLTPNTIVKFLYGDILEELVLILAEAAGHEVTDQQKTVEISLPKGWKLRGRLDAKIDGEIVDVKSASTQSFQKFTKGLKPTEDIFGYITQLGAYNVGEDITPGTPTSFLAIDKQHGHIVRDEHEAPTMLAPKKDLTDLVTALEAKAPPERQFKSYPTSYGNECLGTECSYCQWKSECWKDANNGKGVRTFLYARKPVHLVKIIKEPDVPELKEANEEEEVPF